MGMKGRMSKFMRLFCALIQTLSFIIYTGVLEFLNLGHHK